MFGFNPFSSHQVEEIYFKIKQLKQKYPDSTHRELAEKLIREKCNLCALVGAFTALPAIFPGFGTILAFMGGMATDIALLSYLLAQLVLEIAALYGRDLTGWKYRQEALGAFILASGAGSLGTSLSRSMAVQLSKEAFKAMMEKFFISLGIRATIRSTIIRLIPMLGLFLTGAINYWLARKVGQRAIAYYEAGL